MADFTLPEEGQEKLGVNSDGSVTEEFVPKVGLDYNANLSEPLDLKKLVGESEDQPKQPEESAEEKEPEAAESKQPEAEFVEKASAYISEHFKDAEQQKQLMSDLENYEKFMASNTKKAQAIADEMRQFESERSEWAKQAEQFKPLFDAVNDNELMESLDDWFGNADSNPFRKVGDMKNIAETQSNSDFEKFFQSQVKEVQTLNPDYEDQDKLAELCKYADENHVNLVLAHRLLGSNEAGQKINTLNAKIAELEKTNSRKQSR